jgi:predicted DNA-binding WGR domain protein
MSDLISTIAINEWCLFKSWGGIYNKLGGYKLDTFDTKEAALEELDSIASRKTGGGIVCVDASRNSIYLISPS